MMFNRYSKLLLAGSLLWTATANAELAVDSAWLRAVPPVSPTMAGYMSISNTGSEDIILTGARTDIAGHTMFHAMETLDNGQRRMRHVDTLSVPAGETVTLAPGGLHLMLMRVSEAPPAGENVAVCLIPEQGEELCLDVPVRHNPPLNP